MISGSIFADEWFGPLDFFEKTLWIGLFAACADDQGRLQDNLYIVRSALFPYQDIPIEQIETALMQFATDGKIIRYQADGHRYIQIINWFEHQQPKWANPSKYPAPEGWVDRVCTRINGKFVKSASWDGDDKGLVSSPDSIPDGCHVATTWQPSGDRTEQEQGQGQEQATLNAEQGQGHDSEPCHALQLFVQARGGNVNPMDVDQIKALVDECEEHRLKLPRGVPGADVSGDDWVCAAIKAGNASKQNSILTIRYLQGILNNWQARGYAAKPLSKQEREQQEDQDPHRYTKGRYGHLVQH